MSSDTVAAVPHPNFMDTIIFHMTTWSCCHILGFPRERLSLINIVPSKNEMGHFVIHYENSLTENK